MLQIPYRNLELQQFVEKLDREYYIPIEKLCNGARKQADILNVGSSVPQYLSLCIKLLTEIESYIKFRKDELIPYIEKLREKAIDGHDCSTCSGPGSCKMQHDMRVFELKASHVRIKETLQRLQMAVLPLYSESMYPDSYRILRNHMALLESNLTELFFIEETSMVPKVLEAQTKINAGS